MQQKRIYRLRHKHRLDWDYVGASTLDNEANLKKKFSRLSSSTSTSLHDCALREDNDINNWRIETLEEPSEHWELYEAYWIAKLRTYEVGLNSTPHGKAGPGNSPGFDNTIKRKPVRNLDTGKTYKSITQAARETGCDPSSLMRACKGEQKTSKGIRWAYA